MLTQRLSLSTITRACGAKFQQSKSILLFVDRIILLHNKKNFGKVIDRFRYLYIYNRFNGANHRRDQYQRVLMKTGYYQVVRVTKELPRKNLLKFPLFKDRYLSFNPRHESALLHYDLTLPANVYMYIRCNKVQCGGR